VTSLAAGCRFADCAHTVEPDCAVRAAVAAGALSPRRLASWERLRREQALHTGRRDERLATLARTQYRWASKQDKRRRARP
jgi:ribosome biogenesis GTPase / thiamine phosphate phosphatase